jgi:hypothetical protein
VAAAAAAAAEEEEERARGETTGGERGGEEEKKREVDLSGSSSPSSASCSCSSAELAPRRAPMASQGATGQIPESRRGLVKGNGARVKLYVVG